MKDEAGGCVPQGARAHCESHGPGQRPNLLALVRWQSQAGLERSGRWAGDPPDRVLSPAQTAPEAPGVVRKLAPEDLRWRAAEPDAAELSLGSLRLWATAPVDAQWLELTVSVHRAGLWLTLRVELVDDPDPWEAGIDQPGGEGRSEIWLRPEDMSTLRSLGLSLAELRACAADSGRVAWVGHAQGLGFFVAGIVDMGWPG